MIDTPTLLFLFSTLFFSVGLIVGMIIESISIKSQRERVEPRIDEDGK